MNRMTGSATMIVVLMTALAARADVTVDSAAVVGDYRTFDPAHPPAGMPAMRGREISVTTCALGVSTSIEGNTSQVRRQGNHVTLFVKVTSVKMKLDLHLTTWLPLNATDKIKAHEDGHREIFRRIYEDRAGVAARAAAEKVVGHRYTGAGRDEDAAEQAAIAHAAGDVGKEFTRRTYVAIDRVNDLYDQITVHGTNDVAEDQAISQALERYEKATGDKLPPRATTRPAPAGPRKDAPAETSPYGTFQGTP